MANPSAKRLFTGKFCLENFVSNQESCPRFVYGILCRFYSQPKKANTVEEDLMNQGKNASQMSMSRVENKVNKESGPSKYTSDDQDLLGDGKLKLELAWLTKALEPALQLCRWALPTGSDEGNRPQPKTRSVSDIISSIQRSRIGIQDWSLTDLTVGLYLLYLRQASSGSIDDFKGVQITSDLIVHDLIYHAELAKGAYKDNVASLAKQSMLREGNVIKFVHESSVMRPGYYIGVDPRKKLVIFGIRGTNTVYDLITDIVSSGDDEVTFEGYSTHFGTAEAARWFLNHELETIRKYLVRHEGFKLRLVGHSLGGATASLLAIMIRKKSHMELGFSPDIVSAVGYATPPCVSKEIADNCSDFVTTVLMQDDIIPRLSVASITKLRNEILETDWTSIVEIEDWRSIKDLITNAKQVITSVHDVARKIADYAKFAKMHNLSVDPNRRKLPDSASKLGPEDSVASDKIRRTRNACTVPELFVPGSVYCLKRNVDSQCNSISGSSNSFFTLWKRNPGEHLQRIVLPRSLLADHRCDSHYYGLRDVLKGLPGSMEECIFEEWKS